MNHKKILKTALGAALIAGLGYSGHKLLKPKKMSLGKKLAIGAGTTAGIGLVAHQGYNYHKFKNHALLANKHLANGNINSAVSEFKNAMKYGNRTFLRFHPRYKEAEADINNL